MTAGAYSIPEVQRLLAVLVASKPTGRIAEIGTSYGDGARAIVDALPASATFVTVELDPGRAAQARARRLQGRVPRCWRATGGNTCPSAGRSTSCSPTAGSATST